MQYVFAIFLLSLLLQAHSVAAQQDLYVGTSFEHEVTERFGYEFEIEHRQTLSTGVDNRVLLLFAINRNIGKRLNVAPGVRVTPKHGTERPTTLRLFSDLNYRLPIGDRLTVEGRLRAQYERDINVSTSPEVALRPRLGLAYSVAEKTEFVAEYEARYRFDNRDEFVRNRYTFGMSQTVSTRVSVEAFYRFERALNVADPATTRTIGLYLSYVLPDRRNREWEYRRPFGRRLLF